MALMRVCVCVLSDVFGSAGSSCSWEMTCFFCVLHLENVCFESTRLDRETKEYPRKQRDAASFWTKRDPIADCVYPFAFRVAERQTEEPH